jgi:hypothetical protein
MRTRVPFILQLVFLALVISTCSANSSKNSLTGTESADVNKGGDPSLASGGPINDCSHASKFPSTFGAVKGTPTATEPTSEELVSCTAETQNDITFQFATADYGERIGENMSAFRNAFQVSPGDTDEGDVRRASKPDPNSHVYGELNDLQDAPHFDPTTGRYVLGLFGMVKHNNFACTLNAIGPTDDASFLEQAEPETLTFLKHICSSGSGESRTPQGESSARESLLTCTIPSHDEVGAAIGRTYSEEDESEPRDIDLGTGCFYSFDIVEDDFVTVIVLSSTVAIDETRVFTSCRQNSLYECGSASPHIVDGVSTSQLSDERTQFSSWCWAPESELNAAVSVIADDKVSARDACSRVLALVDD